LIIIINLLISIIIYFTIAAVLIIIDGKPKIKKFNDTELSFDELAVDYSGIPPLQLYSCRDGAALNYRSYRSDADSVLVLIHGSGWHSEYLFPIADYLSTENIATVYTPDLRGHGKNPAKRGDINYINQLVDDLADFLNVIRDDHRSSRIILGGHSSGGGLVLRFAGSPYGMQADAYTLLSPYLKYNAPTMRLNSGGWASPHMPRIIGLSMLNNVKIPWLNFLPVIDFNMPEEFCNGTETLTYSFRLNTGFAPDNYQKDLGQIRQNLLVLAGTADESFIAEAFLPEITKYKDDAEVGTIENVTHMGIVMGNEVRPVLKQWIADLK